MILFVQVTAKEAVLIKIFRQNRFRECAQPFNLFVDTILRDPKPAPDLSVLSAPEIQVHWLALALLAIFCLFSWVFVAVRRALSGCRARGYSAAVQRLLTVAASLAAEQTLRSRSSKTLERAQEFGTPAQLFRGL